LSACQLCEGTGFQIVARGERQFAEPCSCRRPSPGKGEFLSVCRIPARYEHCSLESFTAGNASLGAALEKAMLYCNGYPYLGPADEGLGLLFTGNNGIGKTHLAVAVLRELHTAKGARGEFWDFHELIREIKNSYNPETRTTELQVLAPVVETDILLLDDLGAWKMTDWMNDTLFYILNTRYMAKRATLITTNFQDVDPKTLRKMDPNTPKEFLLDRIGARLRSRLMEMCLVVNMQGDDHREVTGQASNEAAIRAVSPPSSGGR
jgi:DNA replication protein DnaC